MRWRLHHPRMKRSTALDCTWKKGASACRFCVGRNGRAWQRFVRAQSRCARSMRSKQRQRRSGRMALLSCFFVSFSIALNVEKRLSLIELVAPFKTQQALQGKSSFKKRKELLIFSSDWVDVLWRLSLFYSSPTQYRFVLLVSSSLSSSSSSSSSCGVSKGRWVGGWASSRTSSIMCLSDQTTQSKIR